MEEKLRLFIADHPFFKDISQSERLISEIVKNSKIKKMEQYRILINHNEPLYYIYFILSGQISIFVKKQKVELDYEKQLRVHFEETKNKYDYAQQFESENKVLLKKAEIKLKNAFKLVDRNEKQYNDPIYVRSFPNFEEEYLTNINIFPLKRVLTLNTGQMVGEIQTENGLVSAQEHISNITAVSQTKVVVAQIPIDYINTLALPNKFNIISSAFQNNFGNIFQNDLRLICQFFEKHIFKKGKLVFTSKENTEKIYVVGGGEVELCMQSGNQFKRLTLLLQNDMFGYENFIYERSYQAVSCSDDTFLYSIEKQLFFELIENKVFFSQISAKGDEKINRLFYVLMSKSYQKEDIISKIEKNQEVEKDKKLSLTSTDPAKLKLSIQLNSGKKKYQNLQVSKFEFQEGNFSNDVNKQIIIQGQVNTQPVQEKKAFQIQSDKKESRSPVRLNNSKSPQRLKQDQNDIYLESEISDQIANDQQTINSDNQPSRVVSNGDKYKKYKFGFGIQKKKENLTLPSISCNQHSVEDKKRRDPTPNTIALEENAKFSNEKIKEAQMALDEILLLNQKGSLSVTSFESKDTQLIIQKALETHKKISNEFVKPVANSLKNNSSFLQDLSQQENFKEIQEKVKQAMLRKKKSPSPQRVKNKDSINYIIQSRLRKIKQRHHSIENVNSNKLILTNSKTKQSVLPLDIQFQMERSKYQEQPAPVEDSSNRRAKTEISLNITEQMRAITPLLTNKYTEQNLLDLEINFQNETLKNMQQKQIKDQKIQNTQLQSDNLSQDIEQNQYDSQLGSYNLIKMGKKRNQLKYLTSKKQDSDLLRQSSELRNIDQCGISLLSKSQTNEQKQLKTEQNIPREKQKEVQNNNQANMNLSHQKQMQNQQIFIINGESKLIKDKMSTQPISVYNNKKIHQTLEFHRSANTKGQTIQTLETKKYSETLTPNPPSTYCNTIDQLILFEQRSTSQVLNHQTTMPLMDKMNYPNNQLSSNQKNRSLTIEEAENKSRNRLNVTEVLDIKSNHSFLSKRVKTSVSPSNNFTKENMKTEQSLLDQSSIIYEDHPVIHQTKKKLSKLPEILKHKAYIQKKLKRQYIRSNEVQHRFQVADFNKHLQIYQDNYNQEERVMRQKSANLRKIEKTRNNSLSMAQSNTEKNIFSLSQPPQERSQINQQNNQQVKQIKVNPGQIEIKMVTIDHQQDQERQNAQFKQYSERKQSFNKLRNKSKNNLVSFNTINDQEFNEQLYNTLYIKKIICNSPKSKNSQDSQMNSKQAQQTQKTIFQTPKKSQQQSQREIETNALNNISSNSNIQAESNKDTLISPNQMNKSQSQCSFAYGSPIKHSASQPNQDQNKLIILNKNNNLAATSFYTQSKSSIGENSSIQNNEKINSFNQVKHQEINQTTENNQLRQSSIKFGYNQKTKQSSEQETKDFSHLNTLKQLEMQRLTETHFSFQD
ncbi:cyclic nucleotide-binding domain protein (macronuclear) [Tetrahymena thermophila SB210]|uniref:Cyclic nucleotide-binding domain protein n=1 Tax=Tetrahymena thermophila (strain SB210) TaxID=312017 RepID=Q237T9_TETTS|nr:cyclic nucleotide-binding domain protein [Tetrahymena thermophila SB210]EAR92652.2 cyclic nucleotide-binding domain protein [Tetrahymena thermophila SB210]|eukprot:XP_001012897.2 cyclic nucleotide-binding domain protein [Tetrahymena thermophila SB210]